MEKARFETIEQKKSFWHSTSHILADAVKRLWPDVKLGIGPAIDEGFYYDFSRKTPFTPEDLIKIEAQMKKIVKEDKLYKEIFMARKEAEKFLKNEPYKLDLLKDFPGDKISFHQHGNFIDLCNTLVVKSTGQIKAFKLLNIAAAYWRGDSTKPQLQRIYGISFPDKEQLDNFTKMREEAEKRDHKKLGKQLGLFTFSDLVGPGIPLFTPKGEIIRYEIEKFIRELQTKAGYQHVWTGHIAKAAIYRKSGHIPIYQENMFPPMKYENEEYILKPMNCPSHIQLYASQARSYRDLPLRFCEFATLYRHEESGAVSGLVRVRSLTQDDCHVFCRPDQVQEEIAKVLDLIKIALKTFGLNDYWIRLSLRDQKNKRKYLGDDKVWAAAESALKQSLQKSKIAFKSAEGEAAFYGPKMDLMVKDALGREWQLSTIQLDFNQPERFNLEYAGEDNKPHLPVMIHRAVIGSTERFMGVLIEQYAGAFPLWLAPVQVKLLTFTDRNQKFAEKIEQQLKDANIRVESDYSNSTVEYKVRAAELEKVPYILVVGDKEEKNNTVAVRKRGTAKVQFGVAVQNFIEMVMGEREKKV